MSLANAISLHQQGRLDQAASGYRQVLAENPTCHQALHGLGVVMHQRGQSAMAASVIETALKFQPNQPLYYYHLGEVLRCAGRHAEAVSQYRRAIGIDASRGEYYFGLGNALAEQKAVAESIDAYRSAARHAPDDAEIHNNLGGALADYGETVSAIEHLQKAVALAPDYADAHHNLALSLRESGDFVRSLEHAQTACRLDPERPEPLVHLARLLDESADPSGAVRCFRRALDLAKNDATLLANIGAGLRRVNEPRAALEAYRRVLELEPEVARHHVEMCQCLIRLNRFAQAEAEGEKALALDPDSASAHHALATCLQVRGQFDRALGLLQRALELRPTLTEAAYLLAANGGYEISDDDIERWQALKEAPELSASKQSHLYFALAKAYERRREYGTAFEHYRHANRIKARRYPFDPERHSAYVERIITIFSDDDFFAQRQGFGLDDSRPIFIVGMPRSGSTLVEQILASHPQVTAQGEHLEMLGIVRELPALIGSDQSVPECCRELGGEASRQLARRYLDSLPEAGDAVRVCDKMLGNFLRLGVIALLFPHARVVHCVRDPLDTCISCYTQDFDRGLRFTTDLKHLASFCRDYQLLINHWRNVLPLPMIDIDYETLVDSPEDVSRGLIDFCGLPWHDQCAQPHRTQRDVATASFWQARQPVYRQSVGRWRHYESRLGPLIEGLQQHGARYGYD